MAKNSPFVVVVFVAFSSQAMAKLANFRRCSAETAKNRPVQLQNLPQFSQHYRGFSRFSFSVFSTIGGEIMNTTAAPPFLSPQPSRLSPVFYSYLVPHTCLFSALSPQDSVLSLLIPHTSSLKNKTPLWCRPQRRPSRLFYAPVSLAGFAARRFRLSLFQTQVGSQN
jgi:hypothetical protein